MPTPADPIRRRRKRRRYMLGLCIDCPRPRARGRVHCAACAHQRATRRREQYAEHRPDGVTRPEKPYELVAPDGRRQRGRNLKQFAAGLAPTLGVTPDTAYISLSRLRPGVLYRGRQAKSWRGWQWEPPQD